MIVLDASALTALSESANPRHGEATDLLAHLSGPFGSSVVTLAEVYATTDAGWAARLDHLLDRLQVEALDLPAGGARRLGDLRAMTSLEMHDCCVLYTAEVHDAAIVTVDEKLAAWAAELGIPLARPVASPSLATQPVTGPDLAAGRIRIPGATKSVLPDTPGVIRLVLRGREMEARWDPRNGPDRKRSGVLGIGRGRLVEAVTPGERLAVSVRPDGRVDLT